MELCRPAALALPCLRRSFEHGRRYHRDEHEGRRRSVDGRHARGRAAGASEARPGRAALSQGAIYSAPMNPPILHITNIANLPGILQQGGLWSNNHRPSNSSTPISSAHASIQARRATTRVPCGPSGVLHDYVPFYFGARSPMLYANHTGFVAGNSGGQRPLIYLVSDVQQVIQAGLPWVFTDGHAEMLRGLTRAFDNLAALPGLDWKAIYTRSWGIDSETKRKKQAEFLVYRFFPWTLVTRIVVVDSATQSQAQGLLTGSHLPVVSIDSSWYY